MSTASTPAQSTTAHFYFPRVRWRSSYSSSIPLHPSADSHLSLPPPCFCVLLHSYVLRQQHFLPSASPRTTREASQPRSSEDFQSPLHEPPAPASATPTAPIPPTAMCALLTYLTRIPRLKPQQSFSVHPHNRLDTLEPAAHQQSLSATAHQHQLSLSPKRQRLDQLHLLHLRLALSWPASQQAQQPSR